MCSVVLNGDTTFTLTQTKVAIPRKLMISDSRSLFSFLARQVDTFVKQHHSDHFAEDPDHRLHLGFTFSFPVDQKAINKGYLIRWTKGFDIPDAIGKDVCALLQNEIDALDLPVNVAALVNDTVGTLMARSYTSPGETGTLLGAIFGTGTNGAYVEGLERVSKMTASKDAGEYDSRTGEMVVNTEWGSFDNALHVLPDTPYDRAVDANSFNPGIQMFEKRVSGMFLGEILRNAILKLMDSAGLFSTVTVSPKSSLYTPWGIDTSLLSHIESDTGVDLSSTKHHLSTHLSIPACSTEDAQSVKTLVHAIGRRSARLSAVPIAAIFLATGKFSSPPPTRLSLVGQTIQMLKSVFRFTQPLPPKSPPQEEIIDVGVDGSVVEFYPNFEGHLRTAIAEVPEIGAAGVGRMRMGVAKDGSGVGAALIALVAERASRTT